MTGHRETRRPVVNAANRYIYDAGYLLPVSVVGCIAAAPEARIGFRRTWSS